MLQPSEVWTAATAEVLVLPGGAAEILTVAGEADREWLDCAYNEPEPRRRVHEQIVRRIAQPCGFASARAGGVVVSCGLAVEDSGWVGVFSMSTRSGHRRRGLARAILRELAAWAQERGAAAMYLQVLAANTGARELYARSGFTRRYGYQYRVRPLTR